MNFEDVFAYVFFSIWGVLIFGVFIYALIATIDWSSLKKDKGKEVRFYLENGCTCSKDDGTYNVLYNRFDDGKHPVITQDFEGYKKKVLEYKFPM